MQRVICESTMSFFFLFSQVVSYCLCLLLASDAVVRVETLSRLASKVTLGNKIVQQLDGSDQVVVDLALLAPAIDNELHGIQTNELSKEEHEQSKKRVCVLI